MSPDKLHIVRRFDPDNLGEIIRHEFKVSAYISFGDLLAIGLSVCMGFLVGAGIFWVLVA